MICGNNLVNFKQINTSRQMSHNYQRKQIATRYKLPYKMNCRIPLMWLNKSFNCYKIQRKKIIPLHLKIESDKKKI